MRSAQFGILANAALAVVKLIAGLLGDSYALVADAVESIADIFSSLIVWGELRLSVRDHSDQYPFGYGKAEPLAATVVALMLVAAGVGIAVEAVTEIRTPHHAPAPWTLAVLVVVMIAKTVLSRRVGEVGAAIDSTVVRADAWHHLSDALTSAAAFVGIAIAIAGGPGWESADDWAALAASAIIVFNGTGILRPALADLMDRMPGPEVVDAIRGVASGVTGVRAIEKLAVRKSGIVYRVIIHVQADASLSLHDAHILGGRVKSAIRVAMPHVQDVLVHMEPFEPAVTARSIPEA
ncbi:MAG: cation transporter [Acidimicrobiia bacterium]|nr:cation transporter [Acidimicrobiia bacterium]